MSDDVLVVDQPTPVDVIETADETTIVVIDDSVASVFESIQELTLIIDTPDIEIIDVVTQGIPGPRGDIVGYARRTDIVSDSLFFKGFAEPGSNEGDSVWAICRILLVDDQVSETWANGKMLFSNVWENRSLLTYS